MPPKECEYEPCFTTNERPGALLRRSSSSADQPKKPLVYDFLLLLGVALAITTYAEANAAHAQEASVTITDTGFLVTTKLHEILEKNRNLNDWLAFINSLALIVPLLYSVYVTSRLGDYDLIFRIIAAQLLRSFCGFFTHITPDQHYLASNYDYPDIIHCLFFKDCASGTEPEVMPFISFFSGHVANMVIAGNDMWIRDMKSLSVGVHALNAFQVIRMLATRGHYSIDILMGWIVAVYFSSSAAALGRSYSQGMSISDLLVPISIREIFETLSGISHVRGEQTMARRPLKQKEIEEFLLAIQDDEQTEATSSLGSCRSYDAGE